MLGNKFRIDIFESSSQSSEKLVFVFNISATFFKKKEGLRNQKKGHTGNLND